MTGINHETTHATNATAFVCFDTIGFDYAEVIVEEAPAAATNSSNQCSAMVLQHGTTTDPTNATAVTGASTGTSGTGTTSQFTMPIGNNTTFGMVTRFFVDLGALERYIAVDLTPGNSNSRTFSVGCRLTQGDNVLQTQAGMVDAGIPETRSTNAVSVIV
jgi:hypothetical protein